MEKSNVEVIDELKKEVSRLKSKIGGYKKANEDYRKQGIGKTMAVACMRALQKEQINKVSLIAFKSNEIGNHFWKEEGWTFREDLNYYDFTLNEDNITEFNK